MSRHWSCASIFSRESSLSTKVRTTRPESLLPRCGSIVLSSILLCVYKYFKVISPLNISTIDPFPKDCSIHLLFSLFEGLTWNIPLFFKLVVKNLFQAEDELRILRVDEIPLMQGEQYSCLWHNCNFMTFVQFNSNASLYYIPALECFWCSRFHSCSVGFQWWRWVSLSRRLVLEFDSRVATYNWPWHTSLNRERQIFCVSVVIIIFYFENVSFFQAKLRLDVRPRVDNQTSGNTFQDFTRPLVLKSPSASYPPWVLGSEFLVVRCPSTLTSWCGISLNYDSVINKNCRSVTEELSFVGTRFNSRDQNIGTHRLGKQHSEIKPNWNFA